MHGAVPGIVRTKQSRAARSGGGGGGGGPPGGGARRAAGAGPQRGWLCRALTSRRRQRLFFAVRFSKDARQIPLCHAFFNSTHDKQRFQQFYKIHKNIK
jgi:hypothetical protein